MSASAPQAGGAGGGAEAAAEGGRGKKKGGRGKKTAEPEEAEDAAAVDETKLDDALFAEEKEKKKGTCFFDVRMAFKHNANVRDLKYGPEFEELQSSIQKQGFKTEHGQPSIMFVTATVALKKGWVTEAQLARAKELVLAGEQAGVKWEEDVPQWFVERLKDQPFKNQQFFAPVYREGMTNDELMVAIIFEGHHRVVACQRLYPTLLAERTTPPASPTCMLKSPYLPATVYDNSASPQLVQRISYENNIAGHTNVAMDAFAQFSSFRNAIALRMEKRHQQWTEAKEEDRKKIEPFQPFSKQGKVDILQDLGWGRWNQTQRTQAGAFYGHYEAFLKWGAVPAQPGAPPLYVDRLRIEHSTADSTQALHNAGRPVPFFNNPALSALQIECAKGKDSRVDSSPKSLKFFTNDVMTAKTGCVPGCAYWLLRCMLHHTTGTKKASPKPEHWPIYIAKMHQFNQLEQIKADCLAELKKYNVPDSDNLNSAENNELIRVRNLLDYTSSMLPNDALVKEAVAKLTEAIGRFKSHDEKVVVLPVDVLVLARANIRQMRAQPFIAAEAEKKVKAAAEHKLKIVQERQEAQAKVDAAQAKTKEAEAATKAAEQEQATADAAALATEDAKEKEAQQQRAAAAKTKAEAEAKKAQALAEAAQIAAVALAAASASEVVAVKEQKEADAAMSAAPTRLPDPTTVEVGLGPTGHKVHIKKRDRINEMATAEISTLALLTQQQPKQTAEEDADAMMTDETSVISGATAATSKVDTSSKGAALAIDYLHKHFPVVDEDVPQWVAQQVLQLSESSESVMKYDYITMHPPGVHPNSEFYPDQPLPNSTLLELVEGAARLLNGGGTLAIFCTWEQSVTIMQPVLAAVNHIHFGCKGESKPLVWYHSGGEGGRPNQSIGLVSTAHFVVLLHKLDSNNKYRANWTFSGHQSYKTGGGPLSNVWIQPALDQSQYLTVDRFNWSDIYENFKSSNAELRHSKLLQGADGHYTVPLGILSEKNLERPDTEAHEGPDYRPSGKKKGKRGGAAAAAASSSATPAAATPAAASEPGEADVTLPAGDAKASPPTRAYSGDRTDRLILDKSEIPWDVHQHLFKIFLPEPIDNKYDHVHVLDLFSGTQSAAAVATRWPGLSVGCVDFNPVVNAAAQLRLMRLITEFLPELDEENDELKQDNLQKSLFFRFKVDGLTDTEIKSHGADLGCELHRQRTLYYTRMMARSKNCKEVDAVCKSCGKELVELVRDSQNKSILEWLSKPAINAATRRDGYCSTECQQFFNHVLLVDEKKSSGGRLLRNFDNLAQTAFAPYDGVARPGGTLAQQDAARWKRIVLPKDEDETLDHECRQALVRESGLWPAIAVVFNDETEPDTTLGGMPIGVRCVTETVAGEVMCCFTGALNEEGTEAAKAPFHRPPLDITSGLWHQLAFNKLKERVTRRQLLRLSRLCAASYIQPSDAEHPANVTIAPNHLALYRYSLIADYSIVPPGAFCAISNRTIRDGEMLYFDAKQIVTEKRDKFSTAPVLTSDPHDAPRAQGAAGAAADAANFTYVQPWFPIGWPEQLKEQSKLSPTPRRPAKAKAVPVLPKWMEAEVMSDDDEIEHRFKAKPSSSKRRAAATRVSPRSLPKDITSKLKIENKQRELVFVEGIGWQPAAEDEDIFKKHASDVLVLLEEYNQSLKQQLEAEATAHKYGVKDEEEKEVYPINAFVADKLADYAEAMASPLEPKPLRVRMRELPKIALEEIRVLKGRGKDAHTQEELQRVLGEDATGLSNCCLGHSYASLVAEDAEKLNQLSLLKRAQFWDVLLKSDSLRVTIGNIGARSTVKGWQLCKIFLQQYCKILDTLEKRIKEEGNLNLSECPATPPDTDELRRVRLLSPKMNKSDLDKMLKPTDSLWMRFTRKPSEVYLLGMPSEAKPDSDRVVTGLFVPEVSGMLLPLAGLASLSAAEISAAVVSANQWNEWLYQHRKHGYGPGPYTLRTYRTLMGTSVPKAFADEWDAWDRDGGKGLEPVPESEADIQILAAFKMDRTWRIRVLPVVDASTPVSSTATTTAVSTPSSLSDDDSDASESVAEGAGTAAGTAKRIRAPGAPDEEEQKEGGQKEGEQKEGEAPCAKKARLNPPGPPDEAAIGMDLDEQNNLGTLSEGEGQPAQ